MWVKGVAILVLRAAHFARSGAGVDLKNGVLGPIDVGIDSQTEEMLVVVCIDARVHFSAPALGVFARVHRISVENAGKLDFELYCALLMEDPVHAVLVIRSGKDVRDEKLATTSNNDRVISKVGVLEEYPGIFFMDTDGILDGLAAPCAIDKSSVHIVNNTFTIASKRKTIRHTTSTVFPEVKGMLPVMGILRVPVRDDHLRQRQTVENASFIALVVVRDIIQNNAFPIVEANMNFPVLPFNNPAINSKRDTLGLSNVDWFQIFPVTTFRFNCCGMIIIGRRLADRSPNGGNIDVNNFLRICIKDGGKIQRICVLTVIDMRSIIHQGLL